MTDFCGEALTLPYEAVQDKTTVLDAGFTISVDSAKISGNAQNIKGSCRCNDINECKEKIQNLLDALDIISDAKTDTGSMDTKLGSMSETYTATFAREHMDSLCTATTGLNDGLITAMDTTASLISAKEEELRLYLSKIRNEDSQYHREEEERAKRERENNQQAS